MRSLKAKCCKIEFKQSIKEGGHFLSANIWVPSLYSTGLDNDEYKLCFYETYKTKYPKF